MSFYNKPFCPIYKAPCARYLVVGEQEYCRREYKCEEEIKSEEIFNKILDLYSLKKK